MQRLVHIARKGDPFKLRQALEDGADPDGEGNGGTSPLYISAREGHEVCVRILCDFGADPNQFDSKDRLPLDGASTYEMKHLLLSKGAQPDLRRKGMSRAAFFASFRERKLVDLFLSFGASEEEKIRDGRTIRELLDDPSPWQSPSSRFLEMASSNESIERASKFVREKSQHFTVSPEEFVVRSAILMWGMQTYDYPEARAKEWANRVGELLSSAVLREAAIKKFLKGGALETALRRNLREQEIEAERARIKSVQAEYMELYYSS